MKTYLSQLLEDLAKAKPKPSPDYKLLYPNHPALEYGLDYLVEWEMAESFKIADFFGIPAEAFPPADRLTEEQQKQLIEAVLDLWYRHNMSVYLPEEAPIERIYTFLLKMWARYDTHHVGEGGHLCYDGICDLDIENCFWGADCSCKDLDFDMDSLSENSDDLPF